MNTKAEPKITVAIHAILHGMWTSYRVFAGVNPLGPRGGRCGIAVNANQITGRDHGFPVALRIARRYAAKTGAELVLTAGQRVRAAAIDEAARKKSTDARNAATSK